MSDNDLENQTRSALRDAERKIAGEIEPGIHAVFVAACVLAIILSFVLPHAGSASGIDVLTNTVASANEKISITSKIFVYFQLIFGVVLSGLALVTRRWVLAWIAVAGCAVGCVAGMLAWWTRNTPGLQGAPPSSVGPGLIVGWIAMLAITFFWVRVVWNRSNYHLALESQRRQEAADADRRAIELQQRHHEGSSGDPKPPSD